MANRRNESECESLLAASVDRRSPPAEYDHPLDHHNVHGTLLLMKFLYFLSGITASTWGRFCTVYYNEKGLSAAQIGVIGGVMPWLQMLSQPAWGVFADKVRTRKVIALATSCISSALLLLLAVPSISDGGFWPIFIVSMTMSCFSSPSLLDAYTLDLLGEENRGQYGQYRLWNAVSWGLGAIVMGYITDHLGFDANFTLYGIMSFLSIVLIAWKVPNQTHQEKSIESADVRYSALIRSFLQPRIIIFGMGMAMVERLLFLYLLNDLKASTTVCGLTVGVTVIFELPIFQYSDYLLKRLGYDVMFLIAMVSYVVRVYGYTLLTPETVNYIYLLESLHGITFAMMWTSSVSFTSTFAPEEWLTAAQSITSASYYCVGGGFGAVIGGWVMQTYGAVFMYRGAAYIVSGLFAIHAIGYTLTNRKKTP